MRELFSARFRLVVVRGETCVDVQGHSRDPSKIAKAFNALAKARIQHGDIVYFSKPNNVMIQVDESGEEPKFFVKLIDFETSFQHQEDDGGAKKNLSKEYASNLFVYIGFMKGFRNVSDDVLDFFETLRLFVYQFKGSDSNLLEDFIIPVLEAFITRQQQSSSRQLPAHSSSKGEKSDIVEGEHKHEYKSLKGLLQLVPSERWGTNLDQDIVKGLRDMVIKHFSANADTELMRMNLRLLDGVHPGIVNDYEVALMVFDDFGTPYALSDSATANKAEAMETWFVALQQDFKSLLPPTRALAPQSNAPEKKSQ